MWFLKDLEKLESWLSSCRKDITNSSRIVAFAGTVSLFRGNLNLAIKDLSQSVEDLTPMRWNNLGVALAFHAENVGAEVDPKGEAIIAFRSAIDATSNQTLAEKIEENIRIYLERDLIAQYYIELP